MSKRTNVVVKSIHGSAVELQRHYAKVIDPLRVPFVVKKSEVRAALTKKKSAEATNFFGWGYMKDSFLTHLYVRNASGMLGMWEGGCYPVCVSFSSARLQIGCYFFKGKDALKFKRWIMSK